MNVSARFGGKVLRKVYVDGHDYNVKINMPDGNKLFSFIVPIPTPKMPSRVVYILEGGNIEPLNEMVFCRVWNFTEVPYYTLGIDSQGGIYLAIFEDDDEGDRAEVSLMKIAPSVPSVYLDRYLGVLDSLLSSKRPYRLGFSSEVYLGLLNREIGFSNLNEKVEVWLDIGCSNRMGHSAGTELHLCGSASNNRYRIEHPFTWAASRERSEKAMEELVTESEAMGLYDGDQMMPRVR